LACSQPISTESEPASDDLHLGAEGSNFEDRAGIYFHELEVE